jgi:PAS domain S-box-containing protein
MDDSEKYKNLSPSFLDSTTSILDNLLEGFQVISPDFRYLYANNAVAVHGRRSKEDMLGNKMTDLYPGIENTEVFFNIRKCLDEKISITMENEFVFPDQSKQWFEIRLQPIPEGVFILSIDITERKRNEENIKAKENAERANRAKDSFLATMSHEIRTPLTGLLGMLELLSLTDLSTEQKTTLDAAWNSGRSLLRIVSDVLDFSKLKKAN